MTVKLKPPPPPLPWWVFAGLVGGTGLLLVGSFVAWRELVER